MEQAKRSKVIVIGSTNMDMVVNTERIPVPGETILGKDFFMNAGGKGANQAVTIARLGGEVAFITKVGNDVFGHQSHQNLIDEGVDTRFVLSDDVLPSGIALITVDRHGENTIVVNPGANGALLPADFSSEMLSEIDNCDIVLMQFEIPMETILFIAECASSKKKKVIVNPAPVQQVPEELFKYLYLITPNKVEAGLIAGFTIENIDDARRAAQVINKKGVSRVIITLGAQGALYCCDGEMSHVPAKKVVAVDTTAAGDVFNGALILALSKDVEILKAIEFANRASAASVAKAGAQSSIPYPNEVVSEFC